MFTMNCQILFRQNSLAGEKLNNFFYSDIYPAIIAFITAFCYVGDMPLVALICLATFACISLIAFRDITPFMPLPMFAVMSLTGFGVFTWPITYVVLVPVALSLVAHFIIYPIKKFKFGSLFLPLTLSTVALFLGGIFSPFVKTYTNGLVSILAIGPLLLFVYVLFTNYFNPPKNFNFRKYVCHVLSLIGIVIAVEIITLNLIIGGIELGWGNKNAAAAMLLICIPATWYLALYTKRSVSAIVTLEILYISILQIGSAAPIGTAFAFIPIIILSMIFWGKLKTYKFDILKTVIMMLAVLLSAVLCAVLLSDFLSKLMNFVLINLNDDNSRTELYNEAINLFKNYPVFGAGLGYINPNSFLELSAVITYNFHSFIFHIMATMGSVGIIFFGYYYFSRYRVTMKANTPFNIMAFFALASFQVYASVDTGEFNIIPLLISLIILLVTVEYSNDHPCEELLPLHIHMAKSPISKF